MKTPEQIAKIKSLAERAHTYKDSSGNYLEITDCDETAFSIRDVNRAFPNNFNMEYKDVDLTIEKFYELKEIVEPLTVKQVLDLVVEERSNIPNYNVGDLIEIALNECMIEGTIEKCGQTLLDSLNALINQKPAGVVADNLAAGL